VKYHRGSTGGEVSRIQARLQELGFYAGSIDGQFGGGTEIAVRRFQAARRLGVDGIVGDDTWRALFPAEAQAPAPALLGEALELRCLALTGTFETSAPPPGCFCCVAGDFDGQGISFGALQFNLGQGTLQTLLRDLSRRHRPMMADLFADRLPVLASLADSSREEQLAWARTIQDPRGRLHEPWRGLMVTLGRTSECQQAQLRMAGTYFSKARAMSARFAVRSPRALALMFDIAVQNGGVSPMVAAQIDRDIARIDPGLPPPEQEVERLRIVANRRAEAANPRWIEDVRERKLCIANGRGRVHGAYYDLEQQYGLTLDAPAPRRSPARGDRTVHRPRAGRPARRG
jgi:hypothetical protein